MWVVPYLVVTVAFYWGPNDPVLRVWLHLGTVLFVFPACIWVLARIDQKTINAAAVRAMTIAGAISYPLYAIHAPMLPLINSTLGLLNLPAVAVMVMSTVFVFAAAYAVERLVDLPARRSARLAIAGRPSTEIMQPDSASP
jgi:peptidoglycan/LPS O-acetylase OafA/YrhL